MSEPSTYNTEQEGNAAEIIKAAREMREVRPERITPIPDEVIAWRTADGDVEIHGLDYYLDAPRRAEGEHRPGDLASLIRLVHTLGTAEHTTVWVSEVDGTVRVVFDDHAEASEDVHAEPGHGDHRAVLHLKQTTEWRAWLALDGKLIGQEEFAEHIEARIPDIAEPDGATLLEIVTTLTGKTDVNWTSGRRLTDGSVQLQYTEEASAAAGRAEPLEIPQKFVLMIQPFAALPAEAVVPITARLRYRVNHGDVRLGFVLDQPEKVLEDAIANVHEKLASEFPRTYIGSPR